MANIVCEKQKWFNKKVADQVVKMITLYKK